MRFLLQCGDDVAKTLDVGGGDPPGYCLLEIG